MLAVVFLLCQLPSQKNLFGLGKQNELCSSSWNGLQVTWNLEWDNRKGVELLIVLVTI